jgi:hypothetical protein
MKTNTICQDTPCDRGVAELPRFYARQLITADDLTLEQQYFRNKLRAHNRLLHGWGVVCGATVCRIPDQNGGYEPWKVVVRPGYILGPFGDEILIDRPRVFDIRTAGVIGRPDDPGTDMVDPWCSQVYRTDPLTGDLYVAVKYKESQSRPVRVQPAGCGCDDNSCEYSRLQDGYEISIIDDCPEAEPPAPHKTFPDYLQEIGLMEGPNGLLGACVPCPTEPWVVLAKITVDDDGQIIEIDPCKCRRIVISFGGYALRCHTERPVLDSIVPNILKAGDPETPVTLQGQHFKDKMEVYLGKGVRVNYQGATLVHDPIAGNDTYTIKIDVDAGAPGGTRPVVLINPDCSTATFADKFSVEAQEATLTAITTIPGPAVVEAESPATALSPRPGSKRGALRSKKKRATTKSGR